MSAAQMVPAQLKALNNTRMKHAPPTTATATATATATSTSTSTAAAAAAAVAAKSGVVLQLPVLLRLPSPRRSFLLMTRG
jgi:hypothetical protein